MKICNGTTRLVILIGKWAIKIPQIKYSWKLFLNGLLANMQEVEFSTLKDDRVCPILFYVSGGWVVVMPKCDIISEEDFLNLDIDKFHPTIPVENKRNSFGYYNGNIVAIDYGS